MSDSDLIDLARVLISKGEGDRVPFEPLLLLKLLVIMDERLRAAEKRLDSFGIGPHVLSANDGAMALCGGPGACWACDGVIWGRRRHFIPDYDSEGSY